MESHQKHFADYYFDLEKEMLFPFWAFQTTAEMKNYFVIITKDCHKNILLLLKTLALDEQHAATQSG